MVTIKLLGRFGLGLHADVENVLQSAKLMLSAGSGELIDIDFSELDFLYPSGINVLVAIGKHLILTKKCIIKQNFPKNVEVKNFLEESGFAKIAGLAVQLDASIPPHNGSYIYKIKQFTWIDDYEIEKLIDVIEKELKLSEVVRRGVHESLAELILNVKQHSQSPLDCFIIGQGYANTHRIRFCVADVGIGIKKHLGRKYTELLTKKSSEAIEMALIEGITGTFGSQNSGVGLSYLRSFVHLCKGSFTIISGDGVYTEDGKTSQKRNLDFDFPGTLIDVAINSQPGWKIFSKKEPIPKEYKLIK